VFLNQQWVDERLDHGTDQTITVNNKDLDKIWLPDTYFVNAKDSSFHYVTNENRLLQIGPKGHISYRIRLVFVNLNNYFELLHFMLPMLNSKDIIVCLYG
jgi:hypothetical protein